MLQSSSCLLLLLSVMFLGSGLVAFCAVRQSWVPLVVSNQKLTSAVWWLPHSGSSTSIQNYRSWKAKMTPPRFLWARNLWFRFYSCVRHKFGIELSSMGHPFCCHRSWQMQEGPGEQLPDSSASCSSDCCFPHHRQRSHASQSWELFQDLEPASPFKLARFISVVCSWTLTDTCGLNK